MQHSACNLNIVGVFDIVKQELFTTKSRSKTCLLVTLKMNSNLEYLQCYEAMLCMHYLLKLLVPDYGILEAHCHGKGETAVIAKTSSNLRSFLNFKTNVNKDEDNILAGRFRLTIILLSLVSCCTRAWDQSIAKSVLRFQKLFLAFVVL